MQVMRPVQIVAATAALLVPGCQRTPPDVPPPSSSPPVTNATPAAENRPLHLNHAQPKLMTVKLWVGTKVLTAEVAVAPTEVATGMMFRQAIGENDGMLFVFGKPHRASFYMKNTSLPLSAAYLDSEGTILEVHDLQPLDERAVSASTEKVQYVLETRQGWFTRNFIGPGTLVRTELGSLHETFFQKIPVDR